MRISVCIATYNGEKHIQEQISSILDQLSCDDEIIISDDSSTDKTLTIIESFDDRRISVYANQTFKSPIFNFENALKRAKGDFIFLADQDDIWLPGRLTKLLPYLKDFDLVVSDCSVVDEELRPIHMSYFRMINAKPGFVRNLIKTSPYIGCCMAFNRLVLERSLPFPSDIPMHDFWIAMVAELNFKIKFVYEPLVLYRRHASNASLTSEKSNNPFFKKLMFRYRILKPLFSRFIRTNINNN